MPKLFTRTTVNAILLTGILTALMHPFVIFGFRFPDLGFLAWIHLVPIVVAAHRHGFKQRFALFWFAGMAGLLGVLYWLTIAMQHFGGVALWQSVGILILLVAFLASLMALPLATACWVNGINKIPLFILLPAFMMLRDYFIGHEPWGGFPWMLPAYSQGQWLKFFQWVDHTGLYGLSCYIYLVNGLIADGLILFLYGSQLDKLVSRLIVVFMLSLVSLFLSFLASRGYENKVENKGNIHVALVQANVRQDMKWDPFHAESNLHRYLHLTSQAVKNGAELVFWPETAYPYGLRLDDLDRETFLDRDSMEVPLIFGAVVYDAAESRRKGGRNGGKRRQYNGVFQVGSGAKIVDRYFKMHLVPFGEYLPMESVLSKLGKVVNEVGTFDPGTQYELFEIAGLKFGSLICFEDVFPENAREFAKRGADVLVNYTNDAWYEDSSAQYQHLVFSQFRALETRRPLLRATNTGYTAVINAKGEVIDELTPFQETTLLHHLKVETGDSFYVRHGDAWVIGLMCGTGAIFAYTLFKFLMGPVRRVD